jgi:two-component system, LytTR family, sensor kinase
MIHPVFKNLKAFVIYVIIWILFSGIQFVILWYLYELPAWNIAVDALIFNLIFGTTGLALWFVVRYSAPSKRSLFNIIFNHATSLILFLVIWFGVSYTLLVSVFSNNTVYLEILNQSIPFRLISGMMLYFLLGLTYYLMIYNYNLQEKLQQEARLNTLLKESELNMLKSQINPHFLFNSLNSISSLTVADGLKAREMLVKLSDFLRYSVSTNSNALTTIKAELDNITRYLDIEKVRFGDKLQYELETSGECLKRSIPVMILQPLFENAIKHGVYESTEQVTIHAICKPREQFTEILIYNDFDPDAHARKGAGLGLKNIRERMRLTYKRDDVLKTWTEGTRFFVALKVPV